MLSTNRNFRILALSCGRVLYIETALCFFPEELLSGLAMTLTRYPLVGGCRFSVNLLLVSFSFDNAIVSFFHEFQIKNF